MRPFALVTMSALLATGSGANPADQPASDEVADERQSIEKAFNRWIEAYEAGDSDGVADSFTRDAVYAANTGEVLMGREQIRIGVARWMQGSSNVGQQRSRARLDVQRHSVRFVQRGTFAHDLARFTIAMHPPGCVIDAGHALAVWEKQDDGGWLIDALTVNQDKRQPENACRR